MYRCIGLSKSVAAHIFLLYFLQFYLVSNEGKYTFPLGTQESSSWNPGAELDSIPSINYSYKNKKVTVLLQCSSDGNNEFQAFGEDPKNNYKFQLTHKCACWNGCSSNRMIETYHLNSVPLS